MRRERIVIPHWFKACEKTAYYLQTAVNALTGDGTLRSRKCRLAITVWKISIQKHCGYMEYGVCNYSFGRFFRGHLIFKISGTFLEQVERWNTLEHLFHPHHRQTLRQIKTLPGC